VSLLERWVSKKRSRQRQEEGKGAGEFGRGGLGGLQSSMRAFLSSLFSLFLFSCSLSCARARCLVLFASVRSRRLRRASSVAVSSQTVFFSGGGEGAKFRQISTWKIWFRLIQRIFHR
jgi:hypothetical protein